MNNINLTSRLIVLSVSLIFTCYRQKKRKQNKKQISLKLCRLHSNSLVFMSEKLSSVDQVSSG